MKKLYLSMFATFIFYFIAQSQNIPAGTCAIRYTYDNDGNRTQRDFYCNTFLTAATPEVKDNVSYQMINALYPNPTSGTFKVTFSTKLDDAIVKITSAKGALIQQKQFTGYIGNFLIYLTSQQVFILLL